MTVALTSGHSASLSIAHSSKVGDLKPLAQKSLAKGFSRLVTAEGRILTDPAEALQDGAQLTAIVGQPKLAATRSTFALWCSNGNGLVTWGSPRHGGNSSRVQEKLRSVQQVQATECAFAAILEDGSVVTWGNPEYGGDSSAVQEQLTNL